MKWRVDKCICPHLENYRWSAGISDKSVRRIIKNDLGRRSYKIVSKLLLSYDQKIKRKNFANRVWTTFRKEDTIRTLFSDEKFFDIGTLKMTEYGQQIVPMPIKNVVFSSDKLFPQNVIVWLDACSKSVTPLMILDEETIDYTIYTEKVRPVTLKNGNQAFSSDWIF